MHRFHPPAGKFDGVIGGPPCKWWSSAANIAKARGQTVQPDMIPEFVRCIAEASPSWFVMENVRGAPKPAIEGYQVRAHLVDAAAYGADQRRVRRFSFGSTTGLRFHMIPQALAREPRHGTVTTNNQKWDALRQRPRSTSSLASFPDALEAQGLPADFLDDAPFTSKGKWTVVANGVPLAMGRAVAAAVKVAVSA